MQSLLAGPLCPTGTVGWRGGRDGRSPGAGKRVRARRPSKAGAAPCSCPGGRGVPYAYMPLNAEPGSGRCLRRLSCRLGRVSGIQSAPPLDRSSSSCRVGAVLPLAVPCWHRRQVRRSSLWVWADLLEGDSIAQRTVPVQAVCSLPPSTPPGAEGSGARSLHPFPSPPLRGPGRAGAGSRGLSLPPPGGGVSPPPPPVSPSPPGAGGRGGGGGSGGPPRSAGQLAGRTFPPKGMGGAFPPALGPRPVVPLPRESDTGCGPGSARVVVLLDRGEVRWVSTGVIREQPLLL